MGSYHFPNKRLFKVQYLILFFFSICINYLLGSLGSNPKLFVNNTFFTVVKDLSDLSAKLNEHLKKVINSYF